MIVKQVRLSQQAKDQLCRLKGKRELRIGISFADGLSAILLQK